MEYVVTRVLLCSRYGVLGGCYGAQSVVELLGRSYVVAMVFWVVVMVLKVVYWLVLSLCNSRLFW